MLTANDVQKIFMAGKPCVETATMKIRKRGQILALAKEFQVTPKTIRDIWNRRTWRDATADLAVRNCRLFGSPDKIKDSHLNQLSCAHSAHQEVVYVQTAASFPLGKQFNADCYGRQQPDILVPLKLGLGTTARALVHSPPPPPRLYWPGDALLLAAGAAGFKNQEGYEELPVREECGVPGDADPFAGDWAFR